MQVRKDTSIRRKEIVSAARKLIVESGSDNLTIKKMAHEIGVTEAAIYRHFSSKRDILSFLIDDIGESLIEDIEKNYSGNVRSRGALTKIITQHVYSIEQRKGVTFQVIAAIISFGDEELNNKAYDVINRYISRIKAILFEGVRNGVINSDVNIDAIAKLFFGMIQGLVNMWALSKYRFNLEDEFKPLWNAFLKTINSPKSNSRQ